MVEKTVKWVTMSCFYDVDIPLVHKLAEVFDLEWIVFIEYDTQNCSAEFIQEYCEKYHVKGRCIQLRDRQRSLNSLKIMYDTVRYINKENPDIVYVNYTGAPFFLPLLDILGPSKERIIWTCHDFIAHKEFSHGRLIANFRNFGIKRFRHFQLFSNTQLQLFKEKYPSKNGYFIPLFLKDFGKPDKFIDEMEKRVVFTFFGAIRNNKGIQYLLEAGNKLYETHADKFIIRIFGDCKQWGEKYANIIKHTKAFDLNIRFIENEEIPNIFSTTHYLVLPYLDVTQSGPLLISYNYNIPVIASDHDGFKEYINDNLTGYLFENRNSDDLYKVMFKAIELHDNYQVMHNNLKIFIAENISEQQIIKQYTEMFNNIKS